MDKPRQGQRGFRQPVLTLTTSIATAGWSKPAVSLGLLLFTQTYWFFQSILPCPFSGLGSSPVSFIRFNCHVSLAPLQCVASQFPALGNLWLLMTTGQLFCRMSVSLGLSDVFSPLDSGYVFLAGLSCWWRYFQPLILAPADLANSRECSGVQIKIVMSSLLEFFLDRSCPCSFHPWV